MSTPRYYPTPTTSAEFKSNLALARLIVGNRLGFGWTDGSPAEFSALSPADQQRFTDALSLYVIARPTVFDPIAVEAARRRVNNTGVFGQPLADNSVTASLVEFGNEVAQNAENLATAFPKLLAVLAALAVVTFVGVRSYRAK